MSTDLREQLAALAHEQWSGWMVYLFSLSRFNADGTVTIPATHVAHWVRQMGTPYDALSIQEKSSDREEAEKVLALIGVLDDE